MHKLTLLLLWIPMLISCETSDNPTTGANKANRVNHVGIVVKDLERSIRFYEAVTGEKITHQDKLEGERIAKLQGLDQYSVRYATVYLENLNIDLLEYKLPQPEQAVYKASEISAMHLCFEVVNFDDVIERLKKAGVQFQGEPITYEEEDGLKEGIGTKVISFDDPDGTHLQIMAPKGSFKRK